MLFYHGAPHGHSPTNHDAQRFLSFGSDLGAHEKKRPTNHGWCWLILLAGDRCHNKIKLPYRPRFQNVRWRPCLIRKHHVNWNCHQGPRERWCFDGKPMSKMLAIHSQDTGKTSSNQFLYNFKLSDKNFLKAQDKSSESIWATAHDPPKKPKISETAGITGILLKPSQNSPTFQLSEMLQSIYPYLDPAARRAGLAQRGFHGCSSPATSAAGGSVTRFSW